MRCWQEVPTDLPKLPLRTDLGHNLLPEQNHHADSPSYDAPDEAVRAVPVS